MSVIDEVLTSLEALKSNNPATVVDVLCKLHEAGAPSISSVVDLSNELIAKTGITREPASRTDEDPFPDFGRQETVGEALHDVMPAASAGLAEPIKRDSLLSALEQTVLSYQELLEKHNRDFDAIHQQKKIENEDETLTRLRAAQLALLKYPIAGQAIYAALIREGRQYAKTEEGANMQRQLANSPVVAKARTLFEGLNGGMLSEHNSELPSTYIDGFLDALDKDLEVVLSELGGVEDTV